LFRIGGGGDIVRQYWLRDGGGAVYVFMGLRVLELCVRLSEWRLLKEEEQKKKQKKNPFV
jgi:hypothetical protein